MLPCCIASGNTEIWYMHTVSFFSSISGRTQSCYIKLLSKDDFKTLSNVANVNKGNYQYTEWNKFSQAPLHFCSQYDVIGSTFAFVVFIIYTTFPCDLDQTMHAGFKNLIQIYANCFYFQQHTDTIYVSYTIFKYHLSFYILLM